MEQKQNDLAVAAAPIPSDHSHLYTEAAFASYWRTMGIPTALAMCAWLAAYLSTAALSPATDWLGRFVFFLLLTFLARRATVNSFPRTMFITGMAGFVLGLAIALARLILGFKVYLLFNLISETAFTLGAALLVTWGVHFLAERFSFHNVLLLTRRRHG